MQCHERCKNGASFVRVQWSVITQGKQHGDAGIYMHLQLLCTHSVDHPALVFSNADSHETANGDISEEWHMDPPVEQKMQVIAYASVRSGKTGGNVHSWNFTTFPGVSKTLQKATSLKWGVSLVIGKGTELGTYWPRTQTLTMACVRGYTVSQAGSSS